MKGRERLSEKTIVATIVQKADEGPGGRRYIVVRSSAMAADVAITISREEYDHLHLGMLVTVFQIGWGPLSAWRLSA
jgi:hypothetical protein